jgi:hypothetical protein
MMSSPKQYTARLQPYKLKPFVPGTRNSAALLFTVLNIRSLLPRIFGGELAVAPAGVFRSPRRLFATMATETVLSAPAQGQINGAVPANGKRVKLHGRAFYESIGSPKLILAPMVEQSEFVCLIESLPSW